MDLLFHRVLSNLYYNFPAITDRYLDLMDEISRFMDKSYSCGLRVLIAIGAFEIGMEFLMYRIAENFGGKIYMTPERCAFLKCMESDDEPDTLIQKLRKQLVPSPTFALIHVLEVEEISMDVRQFMISFHFFFFPTKTNEILLLVFNEVHCNARHSSSVGNSSSRM